jgi:ABC-type proline/glycine betaine transport system permease subunit
VNGFRIPVGDWVTSIVDFITLHLGGFFDVISTVFGGLYDAVDFALSTPPFWVILLILVAISVFAKGWRFGIAVAVGLGLIAGLNQWGNAMDTLALTLVAAFVAVVISIPIGIWAARSDTVSAVLKPILDFLQTMPVFVYLIPAIILFGIGAVPGIVASIAFAMAPGVRFTELGIRGVDKEVIEAGHAFGSSPGRILLQIQLPLARPTIMAGINQVIMLSLSMVVIASMVGADGLGKDIIQALSRIDVGLGAEAGLSVVILAIILDRLTASLGGSRPSLRRLFFPNRAPKNSIVDESIEHAPRSSEATPAVPSAA